MNFRSGRLYLPRVEGRTANPARVTFVKANGHAPPGSDQRRQPVRKPSAAATRRAQRRTTKVGALDAFQQECVEVFERAAVAFSLAPSVGQIYGLLFATPDPLCLEEIIQRLGASRGGTFQSLRFLRDLGAVTGGIYLPGRRSEYFQAERNLRQLAGAFLRAQIEPHVAHGQNHLTSLQAKIAPGGTPLSEFQRARYEQMERWHRFGADLLPVIRAFAEKF